MLTRRRFVGLSAVALAGTACRTRGTDAAADLPAPIAQLESMEHLVRPITVEERRSRLDRALSLMRPSKLDAILLGGGTSLEYFTGIRWRLSERLFALVLPLTSDPFVVVPAFEETRAREQLADSPLAKFVDVVAWQEDEDASAVLARAIWDRGLFRGRLGVEETVPFAVSHGLAEASPKLQMVSATPVTAGCRSVKDAHEIELMRLASAATLKAYEATYRSLEDGMTREDVGGLIRSAHSRLGFSGGAMVLVGEDTALPHGTRRPQVVREGTIVLIDGGCSVEGYRSDITRTFVLGQPTAKLSEVFDVVLRAQTAALAAAKPGEECQAVDAAARRVIAEAGYGADYESFTHRLGHGIGMDGHEWPYLVRGNTQKLVAGNTFSNEPGIYLPGSFGVRLEDDMVITADAAELLTPQSPSLARPFGTTA